MTLGPDVPPANAPAPPPAAAPAPPPVPVGSRTRMSPRVLWLGIVLAVAFLIGSAALALWFGSGPPEVVVSGRQVVDQRTCPGGGGAVVLQWNLTEVNGIPASVTVGFYEDGAWIGQDGYVIDGGATLSLSHTVLNVPCGEHEFEVRVLSTVRR